MGSQPNAAALQMGLQWGFSGDFAAELLRDDNLDDLAALHSDLLSSSPQAAGEPRNESNAQLQGQRRDGESMLPPLWQADHMLLPLASSGATPSTGSKPSDVDVELAADTGAVKRAGMNKATREKKRRERLNERFSELGALLDLTGANVDKLRVLSEAISTLKSLREEAQELKNTNHRLHIANTMTSEMVATVLQAQKAAAAAGGEENKAGGVHSGGGIPTGSSGLLMQLVPPPLTQQAGEQQPPDQKRLRLTTPNGTDTTSAQYSQYAQYAQKAAQQSTTGNMGMGAWVMGPNGPMLIPPNAPMSMWMPAAAQDISQDHLLRPPVA